MEIQLGDTIRTRAFKADGHCYRWWFATIETITDSQITTVAEPGHQVWEPDRVWRSQFYLRTFYWFDRSNNLLECYNAQGTLDELYANISSPVTIKNNEIHFTDYELDVSWESGKEPVIVDEDEFEEAIVKYGYSAAFQEECWQNAQDALQMVKGWDLKGKRWTTVPVQTGQ